MEVRVYGVAEDGEGGIKYGGKKLSLLNQRTSLVGV